MPSLTLQIDRLDRVLTATSSLLKNLRLAIAGTIALTDELVEALEALHNSRVPRRLAKISWESSALGAWFASLLTRHDQLWRWLNSGRPRSFLLPAFFNPQGFLTAVRACGPACHLSASARPPQPAACECQA